LIDKVEAGRRPAFLVAGVNVKRIVLVLAAILIAGAGVFWFLTSPARQEAGLEPIAQGAPDLANGEVVFYAGGCTSCHAIPKQDDKRRLGGGFGLKSPFGTFYVPNISPHREDGIGGWSLAQFQRAMRGGVSPNGQHYYPAFPYTSFQRMTATDLRDLFGYMMTLRAVEGPIRRKARAGTGAPIWSRGRAIAPSAIASATSSGPFRPTGASRAGPIPKARGAFRTSPRTNPA
jgi:hypothetical protein